MRLTSTLIYTEIEATWHVMPVICCLYFQDYIDINMTFYMHSQVPITFTCMWGGGNVTDFLKPPPPKYKGK